MNKPLIVGLTGGISSGKTTVAQYLESLGAHVIDTDIIAREVVAPGSPTTAAIVTLMGTQSIVSDGNLNRSYIKEQIFNNAALKEHYEAIIHPAIRTATQQALESAPNDCCYRLLVVPLLFEKGMDRLCDYSITVDISEEEQIRRGIARKPEDASVIKNIIATQMPRAERNKTADFIICNDTSLDILKERLNTMHHQLIALGAQHEKTP